MDNLQAELAEIKKAYAEFSSVPFEQLTPEARVWMHQIYALDMLPHEDLVLLSQNKAGNSKTYKQWRAYLRGAALAEIQRRTDSLREQNLIQ